MVIKLLYKSNLYTGVSVVVVYSGILLVVKNKLKICQFLLRFT